MKTEQWAYDNNRIFRLFRVALECHYQKKCDCFFSFSLSLSYWWGVLWKCDVQIFYDDSIEKETTAVIPFHYLLSVIIMSMVGSLTWSYEALIIGRFMMGIPIEIYFSKFIVYRANPKVICLLSLPRLWPFFSSACLKLLASGYRILGCCILLRPLNRN